MASSNNQQEKRVSCRCHRVEDETMTDGCGRTGRYTGTIDPRTNKPHGDGRMEYGAWDASSDSDGDEDDNNSRNGDNESYDGQWVQGDWTGYGKHALRCGSRYQGGFLDNLRHGLGVVAYPDGRVYDGSFQLGRMGKGRTTYADGSSFWGYYHCQQPSSDNENDVNGVEENDGIPHGRGKLVLSDGCVYDGEFVRGVMSGHGRMTWPDGRWYLGEWCDGERNGLGLEVSGDGDVVHEGVFCYGRPVSASSMPAVGGGSRRRSSTRSCLLYRPTSSPSGAMTLVGPIPAKRVVMGRMKGDQRRRRMMMNNRPVVVVQRRRSSHRVTN